ncbi:MAG: Crp/Fnr family transcriptional regulator [Bryobacteraceae bacterium]
MSLLANAVRAQLLTLPEVNRLSSLHRSATLFSQEQTADALFFIDEGLVKLTRTNGPGDRIILSMSGPGEPIGEEALSTELSTYQAHAEVLTNALIYRVPRELVARTIQTNSALASLMIDFLLQRRLAMARKVELLCLHDVEYRILHYLGELSILVQPADRELPYQLPITQAELADLIGATRETTSTTLNQLERRGLVKLSRRLLTIPSPMQLRDATANHMVTEPVPAQ